MNIIQIESIRIFWYRLRLCRWAGSVVTDYRILRNKIRTLRAD